MIDSSDTASTTIAASTTTMAFSSDHLITCPATTTTIPTTTLPSLVRRVTLPPFNRSTAPPGLIEAVTVDPWSKSGKYALGWVFFSIILLVASFLIHVYHLFGDKVRAASHRPTDNGNLSFSPGSDHEMRDLPSATPSASSTKHLLWPGESYQPPLSPVDHRHESRASSFRPLNAVIALFRWVFYRPMPVLKVHQNLPPLVLPSLAVLTIAFAALTFGILYSFIPHPLYYQRIAFGSPPLAIRSGMIACAMLPWLVALSMKANLISLITGIGHERLNVFHRWGGWLCLILSLIHTIPFYVEPIWDRGGYKVFQSFFQTGFYPYGTGVAALTPLCALCIHSLPPLRRWMYELFVVTHTPIAIIFLAMMFWHCNNYLTSWDYLFATLAIWLLSYAYRIIHLNWALPWRSSWLIGDEASVVLVEEDAIKVTVPTKMRWKPGQYCYLRMPGISAFENHPFTIASLCSEDFPSDYGEKYRDMIMVFRPFGGFTRKVYNQAVRKGPYQSYRAFLDGPYGGCPRQLEAFDTVVLIAGGSGVTSVVSHLLHLIKCMRDGQAATKHVHVIWAMKRPETIEWFKEELRICHDFAPVGSVKFQLFITAAKRQTSGQIVSAQTPSQTMDGFDKRVNAQFDDITAAKYLRKASAEQHRHSALIKSEADGNSEKEAELRRETEDAITELPQAHLVPVVKAGSSPYIGEGMPDMPAPIPLKGLNEKPRGLNLDIEAALNAAMVRSPPTSATPRQQVMDPPYFPPPPLPPKHAAAAAAATPPDALKFGFASTPTEFRKSIMRFAFLPGGGRQRDGWSVEYGRPDIPLFLRQTSCTFGRRSAVFVCGPPSMRVNVQQTIAQLQSGVLFDRAKVCPCASGSVDVVADKAMQDEIFLHTENYSI